MVQAYCHALDTKDMYCSALDRFGDFYGKNLRASLFAGFLSLGGFLLSLKTFIIVNMKKDVYDDVKYIERYEEQSKLGAVGKRLDPLRELSGILFAAILFAIIAAILQITVGLFETFTSTIICMWAATFATMLLIKSLLLIRSNLNLMFSNLDD